MLLPPHSERYYKDAVQTFKLKRGSEMIQQRKRTLYAVNNNNNNNNNNNKELTMSLLMLPVSVSRLSFQARNRAASLYTIDVLLTQYVCIFMLAI